jgi:acyl-[acyl carrier protein]--UDP-N-acetylglucosamine O-acyltransferase
MEGIGQRKRINEFWVIVCKEKNSLTEVGNRCNIFLTFHFGERCLVGKHA